MKLIFVLAALYSLLLVLFLWLRPVAAEWGEPASPVVSGQARHFVPDGTVGGSLAPLEPLPSFGLPLPRASAAGAASAGISHNIEIERLILEAVNAERAKARLGALQPEPLLQETARGHSDDMFVRNFFAHDDPDGWSPADRIEAHHRRMIGLTGENIWQGRYRTVPEPAKLAREIMDDWLHSPGHRANILKADYTHLGVGVALKGQEVKATQNFGAIRALTEQEIPAQVRRGTTLKLAAVPLGTNPKPERYDLFLPEKGLAPDGSRELGDGQVQAPAGVYKLRFFFRQASNQYSIYWGPRVEVR